MLAKSRHLKERVRIEKACIALPLPVLPALFPTQGLPEPGLISVHKNFIIHQFVQPLSKCNYSHYRPCGKEFPSSTVCLKRSTSFGVFWNHLSTGFIWCSRFLFQKRQVTVSVCLPPSCHLLLYSPIRCLISRLKIT